jgi:hypothetical protein
LENAATHFYKDHSISPCTIFGGYSPWKTRFFLFSEILQKDRNTEFFLIDNGYLLEYGNIFKGESLRDTNSKTIGLYQNAVFEGKDQISCM